MFVQTNKLCEDPKEYKVYYENQRGSDTSLKFRKQKFETEKRLKPAIEFF